MTTPANVIEAWNAVNAAQGVDAFDLSAADLAQVDTLDTLLEEPDAFGEDERARAEQITNRLHLSGPFANVKLYGSAKAAIVAARATLKRQTFFSSPGTNRTPLGLAPLPMGVFATFLSFAERWRAAKAVADSMPGYKDGPRFERMTYDELAQMVRDAWMSDTELKARAQALSNQTGINSFHWQVRLRFLRHFSRDFLSQVAHGQDGVRLESALINMIIRGDRAAVRPLISLFPGGWTTRFLKIAANGNPKIHQELLELSEERPLFWRIVWWMTALSDYPPPLAHLHPDR